MGSLAIQIARLHGAARVIAVASTEHKRRLALELGADAAIDGTPRGFTERLLEANGAPVDVVLESIGGPIVDRALKALAHGGRLVAYGQASGASNMVSIDDLLLVSDAPPLPVGDAVHMVMERVTLPAADDLEAIADDVCKEGGIATQTDDVIAMCRACLQAHCVQDALAGGRWWREVPFVLGRATSPDDADRGPLATGRVDMAYTDGSELIVVDYKTDKDVTAETAEDHALEKHSGQAEIYAQALASATGLPVREVVFVYCKAGVQVRLREGAVIR